MKKRALFIILIIASVLSVVFLYYSSRAGRTPQSVIPDIVKDQTTYEQPKDDLIFSNTIEKAYKEQPFLQKLPIETPNYIIVYDYNKKLIRVRLLSKEKILIKEEIKNKLKEIGVDLLTIKVEYLE
ncbi:MAG: hypothetical protein AAB768_00895 [Patescibacteria group bacterium]